MVAVDGEIRADMKIRAIKARRWLRVPKNVFDVPLGKKRLRFWGQFGQKERVYQHEKYWRPEEFAYLRQYYGLMPLNQLAKNLGRSEFSVMLKRKRLGLSAVHQWDTIYTSSTFADALGIDRKTGWELLLYTPRVLDKSQARMIYKPNGKPLRLTYGLRNAPERRFPTVELYEGNEPMLAIYKQRLRAWLANPLNHWFLTGERAHHIVDAELRQIVLTAQKNWGDVWLTTGQAAGMVHVTVNTVNAWVKRGWLPSAIRYGNWRILRSELLAVAHRQFGADERMGRHQ
jgi:hypothetical protein